MRYTSSAPSVNQMRFLSSVAFDRTPRLRLAASCSAADAMRVPPHGNGAPVAWDAAPQTLLNCCPHRSGARGSHGQAQPSASAAGAVVVTVPPAASTAAMAAWLAPVTVSVTARLISPFASRRTPESLEEVFTTP